MVAFIENSEIIKKILREKIHCDRLIPGIGEKLDRFEMDSDKLQTYEEYYRYYPQYFEAVI